MYTTMKNVIEDFMSSGFVLGVYLSLLLILTFTVLNVLNPIAKSMCMICFIAVLITFCRALLLYAQKYAYLGIDGMITLIGSARFWRFLEYDKWRAEDFVNLAGFMMILAVSVLIYFLRRLENASKHKFYKMDQNGKFVGEKAMANSNYEAVPVLPPFQAAIMVSLDGITYRENGQCYWVDEGLLTAAHVIEGYEFCCIYRDQKRRIEVPTSVFEIGQGDFACCREPLKITQKIGLSKAILSSTAVHKDAGLSVNVIAFGRRSIGHVNRHPQFGFVEYTGSTASGFSGAPYYFGRTVFGMHLGSGTVNLGYDAAFLKSELRPSRVIRELVKLKPEDSATWLVEQLDRQEEVQYWQSPFDPTEYKVRVGDTFHIVDGIVLDKILDTKKSRASTSKINYLAESRARKMVAAETQTVFAGLFDDRTDKNDPIAELTPKLYFVDTISTQTDPEPETAKTEPLEIVASESKVAAPVPIPEGSRHEDPLVAMVRGVLQEWGKTSIYTANPVAVKEAVEPLAIPVKQVEDLPLAPRDAMTFEDSGNLLRAPAALAGAPGMVYQASPAQNPGQLIYPQMVFPYPPPSANYHMESRSSMPAPQNVAFTRTQRNRNRRINRQQQKRELELYKQHFGLLQNGDVTSQPRPTQMPGSTENSIEQ
uniref:Serine protease n=1 Tax=Kisumu mosquito virus TaxID=2778221 RepID=A0A7S6RMC8_9VIRU|nr:hypothetical protein [Kisumu mosquito virus]